MSRNTLLATAVGAASLALVASSQAPAAALPDWRTTATQLSNPAARSPMVVDLRWAEHKRFDRVVIDVDGRRPGLLAKYVERLTYDGSGNAVPLRGRHKFMLALRPARAHDRAGHNVYTGPRLRQVGLPTLRGIAFTGDFEGVVSFGFTTRTKPYRVFTLTDPSRVVVDWKH
jgi:hypothetical protein